MTKKEAAAAAGGFLGGLAFYFLLGGLSALLPEKKLLGISLFLALAGEISLIFHRAFRGQYILYRRSYQSAVTCFGLLVLVALMDKAGLFSAAGKLLLALLGAFPLAAAALGLFKPQWFRWKLRKIPYLGKIPHAEKKMMVFWGSVGVLAAAVLGFILLL